MKEQYIKKLLLFTPLILAFNVSHGQGLMSTAGANIVVSGSPSIVVTNGNWNTQGPFVPGQGTVKFTGGSNATVWGNGLAFYDLEIDKSANDLSLDTNISVSNNLTMTSRHIQLAGFNIDLGTTGTIVNETNTSYITGTTGGTVIRTETLNAPAGVNAGNIGVEITSAANMGTTQIIRGHVQQQGLTSGIGIARYFDIIPAAGMNNALDATVEFHYLDDELMGLGEAELAMSTKSAPAGWWFLIGENGLDLPNNILTKNNIDTFGRITLTNEINNPLPIKLVTFTGRLQNGQTLLNWQVANEAGILKYDVERSADGKSFKGFTAVIAKGQNQLSYSYDVVDPSPFNGFTYYRLKVHENDGKTSYSQIAKVNINQSVATTVYPNPVTDRVNIEFYSHTEKTVSIKLLDVTGKLVSEKTVQCAAGNNKVEWTLSAFAQATYYLQMEGENSQIKLIKL